MSLKMKITFIVAFAPLVAVSVYGLATEAQPVFVVFSLWAIGVTFVALVCHFIFGGKRANKAAPQEAAQQARGYSQYEPIAVSYPRGLHD